MNEVDKDYENSVCFHATREILERLLDADSGKTVVRYWPDSHSIDFTFEVARLDEDDIKVLNHMSGGRLDLETFKDSVPPIIDYSIRASDYIGGKKEWRQDSFFVTVTVQFSKAQWKALKKWRID